MQSVHVHVSVVLSENARNLFGEENGELFVELFLELGWELNLGGGFTFLFPRSSFLLVAILIAKCFRQEV